MAKRFTNTEIWDTSDFRKLSPKMKCTWRFLNDKCNHAGLWHIDMESLSFFIGECVSFDELMTTFDLIVVREGLIYINGFIELQYGCSPDSLNPNSQIHRSISTLIQPFIKGICNPCSSVKDKDKDKDKSKSKEKEKDKDPEILIEVPAAISKELIPTPQKPQEPQITHIQSFEDQFHPEVVRLKKLLNGVYANRMNRYASKILRHWGSVEEFEEWTIEIGAAYDRSPRDMSLHYWIEICIKKEIGVIPDQPRANTGVL